MNFQTQHLSSLSKYAGIGFIAGAVNHGMFSEQRSLVTAGMGVLFFLIGAYVENRSQVGEAVTQMDQVTQQNAALVEQMAAAASSLKTQAGGMVQTVAVFKVGATNAS